MPVLATSDSTCQAGEKIVSQLQFQHWFKQRIPGEEMAVEVTKGDQVALVIGLILLLVIIGASAQYFSTVH